MKKFLALALAVAMVLCAMVAFSACGGKKEVKVFEAYELTAESYAFAVDKAGTHLVVYTLSVTFRTGKGGNHLFQMFFVHLALF